MNRIDRCKEIIIQALLVMRDDEVIEQNDVKDICDLITKRVTK